ncbi:MAG: rRNA cytosine-C5-methylase [Rhodospirillales bacterium]|nr:rRNA cytosine-C5-methylase [Rhodospirillales bacterium]
MPTPSPPAPRFARPDRAPDDPTREAAFALLSAVLDRRRPLDDALDALPPMEARDRAAGHRLAAATLRRLGTLDAALDQHLRHAPPEGVRHVLRLGAASLLVLGDKPHAAVSTAVALARRRGFAPLAGLVNAVLRRLAATPEVLTGLDGPRLDTPAWLWASWGQEARAIAEAHAQEAPLDLTLKPGSAPIPGAEVLPTGSLRLPAGTAVATQPGFAEGAFWVQDAAAALPARLLAPRPGERIADLCAAPGGKTMQLAAAGAAVIAVDRDQARLARVAENLGRTRLAATLVAADARSWTPETPLDAVLLDAPCSATGTIRRHPDIPHLRRPRDVAALTATQDQLLDAACRVLRPGGRLVYAVCSLQPEEGAARIAAALARLPLRPEPFTAAELAAIPEARTPQGDLRTTPALWPGRGGMDGFFAARLTRL